MINASRNVQSDWLYDQHCKVNENTMYYCYFTTTVIILWYDTNVQKSSNKCIYL